LLCGRIGAFSALERAAALRRRLQHGEETGRRGRKREAARRCTCAGRRFASLDVGDRRGFEAGARALASRYDLEFAAFGDATRVRPRAILTRMLLGDALLGYAEDGTARLAGTRLMLLSDVRTCFERAQPAASE